MSDIEDKSTDKRKSLTLSSGSSTSNDKDKAKKNKRKTGHPHTDNGDVEYTNAEKEIVITPEEPNKAEHTNNKPEVKVEILVPDGTKYVNSFL